MDKGKGLQSIFSRIATLYTLLICIFLIINMVTYFKHAFVHYNASVFLLYILLAKDYLCKVSPRIFTDDIHSRAK